MNELERLRARLADPVFVAAVRAERVAQGLPATVESEAVYELFVAPTDYRGAVAS